MINIAIVGLGKMGINHLNKLMNIREVNLIFIYDIDIDHAKALSKRYKVPYLKDLQENVSLDAVIISSSTSSHLSLFKHFSKFVSNIFIEKPVALSLKDSTLINKIATENNINLHIGYIERFNSSFLELVSILSKNKVLYLEFYREDLRVDKLSQNIIFDLMIHDIDLSLLLGGSISKVSSTSINWNDCTMLANATLIHKNGIVSQLKSSYVSHKPKRLINITCKSMYITCNLLSKKIVLYKLGKQKTVVPIKIKDQLEAELDSFIFSCNHPPSSPYPYNNDLMNVCENIQASMNPITIE